MTDHEDINPYQSPLTTEAPPPQLDEKTPRAVADRSARLLAVLTDGFLEIVSLLLVFYAFGLTERYFAEHTTWLEILAFDMPEIFLHYALHGYLLATRGQTVGKLLMGIRIEDRDTGELISMSPMVLRRDLPVMLPMYLFPIFLKSVDPDDLAGVIILLIDTLFIFTATRRCLHDRIANTKVVRTWS